MSVNAGAEEEYEKRRNPIWPELGKVLRGVSLPKCPAKFAPMSLPANFCQIGMHKTGRSGGVCLFIGQKRTPYPGNVRDTLPLSKLRVATNRQQSGNG